MANILLHKSEFHETSHGKTDWDGVGAIFKQGDKDYAFKWNFN